MTDLDLPTASADVAQVEPDAFLAALEAGSDPAILDVRAASEVEAWAIDRDGVPVTHVPYFEFLDEIDQALLDRVPDGDPLVVVCAKGGASAYVAGRLAEHGIEAVNLADGMRGWATVYDRRPVTAYDGPGRVVQYQRPSSGCLSYLVVAGDQAAVIDPLRAFADRYRADAAEMGATLRFAFDTHVHADHVSGVRALDDAGVEGVVPTAAVDRGIVDADVLAHAADGDAFTVGEATIEARHTPGHTSGMTSYLVGDSLLATGDGLFVESVARPDLEAGDAGAPAAARTLYATLSERIRPLPDDTVVGGAHYSDAADPAADGTYTAILGDLADRLSVLSMDEGEFVDRVLADMPPRPANYEEIIATNLGRRTPDDETAFELELGPNNCAASRGALTGD